MLRGEYSKELSSLENGKKLNCGSRQTLLHIGFPKTGTTWLHNAFFSRHPEFHFLTGKILGWDSVFDLANHCQRASAEEPRYYVTSSEIFATPIGTAKRGPNLDHSDPTQNRRHVLDMRLTENRRRVATLLRDLFPESRILLVTRGFSKMMVSMYSQFVCDGGTLPPRDLFQPEDFPFFAELLDYDAVIRLYEELFGKEKVLALPHELLQQSPERFVRTLEKSLGVTHHEISSDRVNISLPPEALYWGPVISRYVNSITRVMGPRWHNWLQGKYVQFLRKRRSFLWLVKGLNRWNPRKLGDRDFEFLEEHIHAFRGRAEILADKPHYQDYRSSYLIEQE